MMILDRFINKQGVQLPRGWVGLGRGALRGRVSRRLRRGLNRKKDEEREGEEGGKDTLIIDLEKGCIEGGRGRVRGGTEGRGRIKLPS